MAKQKVGFWSLFRVLNFRGMVGMGNLFAVMMKNQFGKYVIRIFLILNFSFFILHFSSPLNAIGIPEGQSAFSQTSIQTFTTIPRISIRALHAVSDNEAWFAANRGVWGYTEDAGKTWHIDSIRLDTIVPEFRALEVLNDSTVLLMGIASPALIFKTTNKGKTWKIVYRNDHKDIFFDSMKFLDKKNGMVLGDPIDGKWQLIKTENGGDSWDSLTKINLPALETGEAFFAASNSCFDFHNHHCWVGTGGKKSRLIYSSDGGETHSVFETPLPEGSEMTGIFSVDFYDSDNGVVAGGDYDKADTAINAMAITNNGGKSWKEIGFAQPVFGSCVQFLSRNEILITGIPGTFRYHLKSKQLTEIKSNAGETCGFHTLRVSPSKKVIWLAGADGKIGRMELLKK
jgi:photosystem II stability/assembly factor-like uncharacterized protein